nr:hypothetical transcript [Hymenolepis microstoma]
MFLDEWQDIPDNTKIFHFRKKIGSFLTLELYLINDSNRFLSFATPPFHADPYTTPIQMLRRASLNQIPDQY